MANAGIIPYAAARPFVLFSPAPPRVCVLFCLLAFSESTNVRRRRDETRPFVDSLARKRLRPATADCSCNRPSSSRSYIFQADSRPTGSVAISRSTKHNAAPPKTCLIFRQKRETWLLSLFVCLRVYLPPPLYPLSTLSTVPDSVKHRRNKFYKVSYA